MPCSCYFVCFHAYYTNPDESRKLISELEKTVKSYSPAIKLVQGESGCPAHLEWTHALRYLEWSEYSQAKWDARRMACDYSMGIPSSLFTIVDLKYPNMQQSFGLLRANLFGEVIYKRPAWHTVQNMASLLTPDVLIDETVTASVESVRHLQVCGLKDKDGKQLGVMLYFDSRPPTDCLEREYCNLVLDGITFKDPVYVEPITGQVLQLRKDRGCDVGNSFTFYDMPLWDSPVFIMEKSAVRLQDEAVKTMQTGGVTKELMF